MRRKRRFERGTAKEKRRQERVVLMRWLDALTHLPNTIGMLPLQAQGGVEGLLVVLAEIINGHIAIVQADGHQERISRMNVAAHHPARRCNWKKRTTTMTHLELALHSSHEDKYLGKGMARIKNSDFIKH